MSRSPEPAPSAARSPPSCIENGHQVLLIDKDRRRHQGRPRARRRVAAGRRVRAVVARRGRLERCDVVIAATGDDKANLVISLLAKTEFAVPRTVGRVNHPANEWLFNESWGVDVSVSTPRIMSALVEEAVSVGDLVRLFTFQQGNANLVELTLPTTRPSSAAGARRAVAGRRLAGGDPARRRVHRPTPTLARGRRRAAVRRDGGERRTDLEPAAGARSSTTAAADQRSDC